VGRRERPRRGYARRSFLARYRTLLIVAVALVGAALLFAFFVLGATAKSYTCGELWSPAPTASPAPGATPQLGYPQPDMGNSHNVKQPQNYPFCPPASGPHYALPGLGPIQGRYYGPDDFTQPQGWVHNMEHGARVLLYRCPGPGCDDPASQAKLKSFFQTLPNPANCGTVIARFDEMKWPFAALVWDRVLPLETFDEAQIRAFFDAYAQRTNPEPLCPRPAGSATPTPSSSASPAASGSGSPSTSPASSASPAASSSPSASPTPTP
jgi:hypothetical protein